MIPTQLRIHPGLLQLQRSLAVGIFRRMFRRIASPRRILLTSLATVLAFIWLGQAVAGVIYRRSADPARLAVWLPCGFTAYALWHIIKTVCRRPLEPFEWTETERELLLGAPLPRRQLVLFRLGNIISAASLKALCFSFVMIPDIKYWLLSLVGMLLTLTILDIIRMIVEVIVWCLSPKQLLKLRIAVVALAVGAGLSAFATAYQWPESIHNSIWPAPFGFAWSVGQALLDLRTTLPGRIVVAPFQLFSGAMLEVSFLAGLAKMLPPIALTSLAAWALVRLDERCRMSRIERERANFESLEYSSGSNAMVRKAAAVVKIPPRWHGAYTMFWRQLRGMYHYRHSLAFSFLLPAGLSLLPLFSEAPDFDRALHIVGSLIFYSFLLMPSALRFDFRRDIERMPALKALPIEPIWMTIGQLAAPVLTCTVFQAAVLAIGMLCRPFHPMLFFVGIFVLIPINALIFSFENLIYLLFPYRLNQEGVNIFLRSILTFTGKGVLFFCGLVASLSLAMVAAGIANRIPFGTHQIRLALVFSILLWLALAACVVVTTLMVARVYRRFDPSQDLPTLS